MSAAHSLEARVSALEDKVSRILDRVEGKAQKPGWIDRVVGSFADRPEFDEVLRLGREFRQEQNKIEDVDESQPEDPR